MKIFNGVDIVSIKRMEDIITKRGEGFLNKVYTKSEKDYCNNKIFRYQHFAGKFAAKEAFYKACKFLWKQGISFKEIEIKNDKNGLPEVLLSARLQKIVNNMNLLEPSVSISHCREYAIAMVIIKGE